MMNETKSKILFFLAEDVIHDIKECTVKVLITSQVILIFVVSKKWKIVWNN